MDMPLDSKHLQASTPVSRREKRTTPTFRFGTCRSAWHGLDAVTELVTFGDSCTRYGSNVTWINHFSRQLNSQKEGQQDRSIRISNYAVPGSTVEDDLEDQVANFFNDFPVDHVDERENLLEPNKTLYIFWHGTNDCGRNDEDELEDIVDKLFSDGIEELYVKAGARNFLIIDVPPMNRSPAGAALEADLADRYTIWNEHLESRADAFARSVEQASVFLFSSHNLVSHILDNPEQYGLQDEDTTTDASPIWLDELHFTSDVHAIVADRLMVAFKSLE